MATRNLHFAGLRASIFGDAKRVGVEFSLRRRRFRQARRDAATDSGANSTAIRLADPETAALAKRVAEIKWYHTIDLGGGVTTPGFFDHRSILSNYRLPERLSGLRVLDIATFDGFWAFEFERRGASEVVALDVAKPRDLDLPFLRRRQMTEKELELPFGAGFRLAHGALRSKVRLVQSSVYDLSPDRLGLFDVVHCGDLLIHLRDPAWALWSIRSVTRGHALISECIDPDLERHDDRPVMQYGGGRENNIWWRFSASAVEMMMADAGFAAVDEIARFRYGPFGHAQTVWHAVFRGA